MRPQDYFKDPSGRGWDPNPDYRPLPWDSAEGDGFSNPHALRNTIDLGEMGDYRSLLGLDESPPQDVSYPRVDVPDATPETGFKRGLPVGLDIANALATLLSNRKRRKQGRPTRDIPGPMASVIAREKQDRREKDRSAVQRQNVEIGTKETIANATRRDKYDTKRESAWNAVIGPLFERLHPRPEKMGETEKKLEQLRHADWYQRGTPQQRARWEREVLGAEPSAAKAPPKTTEEIEAESAARARGTASEKNKDDPYREVDFIGKTINDLGRELGATHPEITPRTMSALENRRKVIAQAFPQVPEPMDFPMPAGMGEPPTAAPAVPLEMRKESLGKWQMLLQKLQADPDRDRKLAIAREAFQQQYGFDPMVR